MKNYKSLLTVTATAIGFLAAPSAANAFTLGGIINGEQAFSDLGATIDIAAEGRIGDLSGAAEHEFNIHYDNPNGGQTVPTQYRAFDWVKGQGVNFSLTYANNLLTYDIGGQTLTYEMSNNNLFNDLFIRTTARKKDSSVVVNNLFLNDTAIDGNSSFACDDASGCDYWNSSQYLWLSDLGDSFTLTGTSTMLWEGDAKNLRDRTAPHRSQLAFQLKLGNVDKPPVSVPEPISMSLFSVGAVGLALAGLRRQQNG